MYNSKKPNKSDLPSPAQLLRSTALALLVACTLLITTVLPGEYGIDPTGIGSFLGLTKMGQINKELAQEAALADLKAQKIPPVPQAVAVKKQPAPTPAPAPIAEAKTDEITIRLKPGQAAEVKLLMMQDATVSFVWQADGPINFDAHGDPTVPVKGFYHGYGKGRSVSEDKGILKAAFDGSHGWFWRNRTEKTVTLTLRTKGSYSKFKRVV